MRLNQLVAIRLGIARRKADVYIAEGRIKVDGLTATYTTNASDNSTIELDSQVLPQKPKFIYIKLNKPEGYVCSKDGQGSPTIYDLLPKIYSNLKPVGRLDKDSSGLILMTNDGQMHYKLTHPSFKKNKIYEVKINKSLDENTAMAITNKGIVLEDGLSKLDISSRSGFPTNNLIIKMHEGRNRQIRRTFEALNLKVLSLHRTKFDDFDLGSLPIGKHVLINKSKKS